MNVIKMFLQPNFKCNNLLFSLRNIFEYVAQLKLNIIQFNKNEETIHLTLKHQTFK